MLPPSRLPDPIAPFRGLALLDTEVDDLGEHGCHLLVQVEAGWFGGRFGCGRVGDIEYRPDPRLEISDFLPGGGLELIAHLDQSGDGFDGDQSVEGEVQVLVLCGVGVSGHPSCTSPMTRRNMLTYSDPASVNVEVDVRITGVCADRLLIESRATPVFNGQDRLGLHEVSWP